MRKSFTYKITLCGLFSAFALISFVLESQFPPLFLPGARMGISNIFILLTAVILGGKYGFSVLIVKTVLGSLFAGNISAVIYSLPSGAVALTLELLLLRFSNRVSVIAISVLGAVINSVGQNLTFCLVTGATEYLAYLPYLAIISVVSGIIVGFTTLLAIKKLPFISSQETNETTKE
jgi:heptaprenyl diphosphate synthase